MSRLASQIISRILSVIGIVLAVHLGLVRQDENAAQTAELLSHLRNVVVADQDVLVFLLHQLVARRHDHFDHVLAGGQHFSSVTCRVVAANRAVRTSGRARRGTSAGNAGELVPTVVRRRLYLVERMHAVVALELAVVGQRTLLRIKPLGAASQCEEEGAGGILARAVHVRNAVGAEALGPVVPTGGCGVVNQFEALGSICRRTLLI